MFNSNQIDKVTADKYFRYCELLLTDSKSMRNITLSRKWLKQFDGIGAGVYIIEEVGEIVYVGETKNIRQRMSHLLNTQNHTVRRNIGHMNFSKIDGFEKASSKKKFPEHIEQLVKDWIENKMRVSILHTIIGRKEIESYLIKMYEPKYNIRY